MSKLPPLPDDAFDGERERIELNFKKCLHKNVKMIDSKLVCTCGAGWSGPNIATLYNLFKNQ